MKKRGLLTLLGALCLGILLIVPATACTPGAPTPANPEEPWGGIKYIRAAGSTPGSLGQQLWTIYTSYWDQIPGINSNPVAAQDPLQIFMVSEGEVETGQIAGYTYTAFKDPKNVPAGKQPVTNMVSIWTQTVLVNGFYVRADSDIHTLEDFKGATIGGEVGGGYGGTGLAILEAIGLTPANAGQFGGSITAMSATGAQEGLQDKSLDVWIWGGSPVGPSNAISSVEQSIGLRVIVPPMEVLQKALEIHPEWTLTKVNWTQGVKSLTESHYSLADPLTAGVRKDFPDDLVYKMLEQIFETDCLAKARELGRGQWNKWVDNARIGSEGFGEHPGATKYYEDHGIPVNTEWLYKEK